MSDTPTKDIIKEAKERLQLKGTISGHDCEPSTISMSDMLSSSISMPDSAPAGLPEAPTAHVADPDYKIPTDDNGNPLRTHYGTEEHGESVKDFHNAGGKVPTSNGAVTETQKVEVTTGENGGINTHGGSAWNNINVIRNSGRD